MIEKKINRRAIKLYVTLFHNYLLISRFTVQGIADKADINRVLPIRIISDLSLCSHHFFTVVGLSLLFEFYYTRSKSHFETYMIISDHGLMHPLWAMHILTTCQIQ